MGLFEQRFSDEQVAAARREIASGTSSLRAAARKLGCAPSTLSVRIKKAETTEAEARALAGIGEPPVAAPTRAGSEPAALGAGEAAPAAEVGPVEVLRAALQATKANGQPDWPIQVRAAQMLAALRPEEVEPELELEPEPDSETVVYDLRPGSSPILHTAPPRVFAPVGSPEPPAEPLPEPGLYVFQGRSGPMIPLVRHGPADEVHSLTSHEAAVDILRAFGGDPSFLDAIADADPDTA